MWLFAFVYFVLLAVVWSLLAMAGKERDKEEKEYGKVLFSFLFLMSFFGCAVPTREFAGCLVDNPSFGSDAIKAYARWSSSDARDAFVKYGEITIPSNHSASYRQIGFEVKARPLAELDEETLSFGDTRPKENVSGHAELFSDDSLDVTIETENFEEEVYWVYAWFEKEKKSVPLKNVAVFRKSYREWWIECENADLKGAPAVLVKCKSGWVYLAEAKDATKAQRYDGVLARR